MIMQYHNNYQLDYSRIQVASEFGKMLLDYIKELDQINN